MNHGGNFHFEFANSHSLTEIKLLLNYETTLERNTFISRTFSYDSDIPIIVDNVISQGKLSHLFDFEHNSLEYISNQILGGELTRCLIPLDSYFLFTYHSQNTKFYSQTEPILFALAIKNAEDRCDFLFISNPITEMEFQIPYLPFCISKETVNDWLGKKWNDVLTNHEYFIIPNIIQIFNNSTQNDLAHSFNETQHTRIALNQHLKEFAPSITECLFDS